MKQQEISYNTKAALAAALKARLKKQPLNKISIRELSEDCDINRQTFYYHFSDIYALMYWAFSEDMKEVAEQQHRALTWQEGFALMFAYLQKNRDSALNAYRALGHEHFRNLIYDNVYAFLYQTVQDSFRDIDLPEGSVDFYTAYCIIALVGVVESWLTGQLDHRPDTIIAMTANIIAAQIEGTKQIYGIKQTDAESSDKF
ncbi:MAG: TetR/AcrR family transcriptional regulator C-terminal domain-containing protein [Clostridia bacterium]|nr:TetR/AcrR family transcriptional regulator C-terminal domain-containing protein [Clostridia bacterium]